MSLTKVCPNSDNVLSIDATFYLCSSWVTNCCLNNDRLTKTEGKHSIFLGPTISHFEKDVLLFNRFAFEMSTHRPAISTVKRIEAKLEKTIFNGFLSQITDLNLLLYVFHLHQNDKRNLKELKPKDDIYDRQHSTMKKYGLRTPKMPMT